MSGDDWARGARMAGRGHQPLMRLLHEQLARPSEELVWQIALGEVAASLPPMGPEPFDPFVRAGVPDVDVPPHVQQLWSRPFHVGQQIELGTPGFRQVPTGPVTQPSSRGRWWTLPQVGDGAACLETTAGPCLGAPSVAAFGMEDAQNQTGPECIADIAWRAVEPVFEPRVYEIDGPEAWCRLIDRFPSTVAGSGRGRGDSWLTQWFPGRVIHEPYWPDVAEQVDVVHLTQLAYLTCAYAPIPHGDGVTTVTGWGPDLAVWLRHPAQG